MQRTAEQWCTSSLRRNVAGVVHTGTNETPAGSQCLAHEAGIAESAPNRTCAVTTRGTVKCWEIQLPRAIREYVG
jgi:hypothetical protein